MQVYEAMLVGPGQMPVFSPTAFTEEELNSIVLYVETLQNLGDPGASRSGGWAPFPRASWPWWWGPAG